jgi:hypothetical protein
VDDALRSRAAVAALLALLVAAPTAAQLTRVGGQFWDHSCRFLTITPRVPLGYWQLFPAVSVRSVKESAMDARSRPGPFVAAALAATLGTVPVAAQLTRVGSQFWDQDSPDIQGVSEAGDEFGASLFATDFNGDGYTDLVIGAPREDITFDCNGNGTAGENECTSAGAFHVIYGSPLGLHASAGHADQLLHQGSSGVPGDPEINDHFAEVLAFHSLTGGLAVGVPDEDIRVGSPPFDVNHVDAGAVYTFHWNGSNLVGGGLYVQGQNGVPGTVEGGDHFGAAIASWEEICPAPHLPHPMTPLAIGAPGEGHDPASVDEGGVTILRRGCEEPSAGYACEFAGDCVELRQGAGVFGDTQEDDDLFGAALAILDEHPSHDVLAIGVPGEDVINNTFDDAGLVHAFFGSGQEARRFGDGCVPGSVAAFDDFGETLASGDFDGDGVEDLAVGAPGRDVGGAASAGAVAVLYNNPADDLPGCSVGGDEVFGQDDLAGATPETLDGFGESLAAGDFNGDGITDLVIGVPDEDVVDNTVEDGGIVHLLYGADGSGINAAGAELFGIADPGLVGDPLPGDRFGAALATGNFDGEGGLDLAIGVPGSPCGAGERCGAVYVLYGGVDEDHLDAVDFDLESACVPRSYAESAGTVMVDVVRTGSLILPLNVNVGDLPAFGTATVGVDYANPDTSLHWDAGEGGAKSFPLQIFNDALDEPNETIVLSLQASSHAREPGNTTVTICDNESAVGGALRFSTASQSVSEGGGSVTVQVDRVNGTLPLTITYATQNGSALAGSDYTATSGTLSFKSNETFRTFEVPILDDAVDEPITESFTVRLGQPSVGILVSPSTQTVSITDNDPNVAGSFRFLTTPQAPQQEGPGASFTVTVERIGGSLGGVGVSYFTANGTAVEFQDYLVTFGSLAFAANEISKQFQVPIVDNHVVEDVETLSVVISNPTGGATITGPTSRVLTIVDNDVELFDDDFEDGELVWAGHAP